MQVNLYTSSRLKFHDFTFKDLFPNFKDIITLYKCSKLTTERPDEMRKNFMNGI